MIEGYKKEFIINQKTKKFDIVISSISPDFFYNYKFGELKFIGSLMLNKSADPNAISIYPEKSK